MSQENSKQKRRWIARMLGVRAPKALLLAPVLLVPTVLTTSVMETACGQTATATRSISDNESKIDAGFIVRWLDEAAAKATAGDSSASATAFAEALRARKLRGVEDPAVEKRLAEVNQLLIGKGIKKELVQAAINKLGAVKAAPSKAVVSTSAGSPLDRRDQVAALTQAASAALLSGDRAKASQRVLKAEQLRCLGAIATQQCG